MHATIRIAGSFFTHLIRVAHNLHHAAIDKIVTALRTQGIDVKECESGRKSINVTFQQASFILDTAETWIKIVVDGAKKRFGNNSVDLSHFGYTTVRVWAILKVYS